MPNRNKQTNPENLRKRCPTKESSDSSFRMISEQQAQRNLCRLDQDDGELREENKKKCHRLLDMFGQVENRLLEV